MSQIALLNNVQHKDLRIITKKSAEFGDNVSGCLVYPFEFSSIHKEYPIFLQKDSQTGGFQAVALFGFSDNENLFLTPDGWDAEYIPALFRREPFSIGVQNSGSHGDKNFVINVDLASSRISQTSDGESVFLSGGGNSDYLEEVRDTLMLIADGIKISQSMIEAFLALELIEGFTLDIKFANREQFKTDIFYTIHEERLMGLNDETVGRLHRLGFLHYAYMIVDSLKNIKKLIKMKDAVLSRA